MTSQNDLKSNYFFEKNNSLLLAYQYVTKKYIIKNLYKTENKQKKN